MEAPLARPASTRETQLRRSRTSREAPEWRFGYARFRDHHVFNEILHRDIAKQPPTGVRDADRGGAAAEMMKRPLERMQA